MKQSRCRKGTFDWLDCAVASLLATTGMGGLCELRYWISNPVSLQSFCIMPLAANPEGMWQEAIHRHLKSAKLMAALNSRFPPSFF